jgi:hypothetical protein
MIKFFGNGRGGNLLLIKEFLRKNPFLLKRIFKTKIYYSRSVKLWEKL